MKRRSIRAVLENPYDDEYYVLVTRYYPMELRKRGMKLADSPIDDWDRDLAPTRELLRDYKSGKIDWRGYKERFLKEVPPILMKRKIDIFKSDAKGKEVVLVCVEEESEYPNCHTWIILEEVERK